MFLIVDSDGAQLAVSKGRLVVKRGSATQAEYLKHDVDGVVAVGHVEVTHAAIDLLLRQGKPIHLIGGTGKYLGCLMPKEHGLSKARVNQYRIFTCEAGKLPLAKAATRAQLSNLRAVVHRWSLHRDSERVALAAAKIGDLRAMAADATTLDELRGLEGRAWRLAFGALGAAIEPYMQFTARRRRPSPDPPNALLSLFGTLTAAHAESMIRATGLDPGIGFSHGSSRGAPALALDLTDIYRPMLCLATAAAVITKKVVRGRDFWSKEDEALLYRDAFRRVLPAYLSACRREVTSRTGTKASYLEHMARDAAGLAHALRTPGSDWTPLEVR